MGILVKITELINVTNNRATHLKDKLVRTRNGSILIVSILSASLLIVIILIVLYATVPCLLTRCHYRAKKCVNYMFYADCICDYGYNGNGRDYCDECGVSYRHQNARIVGGTEAVAYSWPFAVLIVASYKTEISTNNETILIEAKFLCSGTLINRKSVLSAAHCLLNEFEYEHDDKLYYIRLKPNKFYPTYESMYEIYLGLHDLNETESETLQAATKVNVEEIKIHEDYDEDNVLNDLMILKLDKLVDLTNNIQLACLPNPEWDLAYPRPNTPGWIVGWGTTSENGSLPNGLRNLRVKIYEDSKCDSVATMFRKNPKKQICAGDVLGLKDTCQGDSGGCLYTRDTVRNHPKFICVGVVSYGEGCGEFNKAGLYAHVASYLDWIHENSMF